MTPQQEAEFVLDYRSTWSRLAHQDSIERLTQLLKGMCIGIFLIGFFYVAFYYINDLDHAYTQYHAHQQIVRSELSYSITNN